MASVGSGPTAFEIGRVLSRAFAILRRNLAPFCLLALLISSPTYIYTLLFGSETVPEENTNTLEASVGFEVKEPVDIVALVLYYLIIASLVYGTMQELRGRHPALGECVRRGLALILPVLGVAIVAWLAIGLAFLVVFLPLTLIVVGGGGAGLFIPGIVLCLVAVAVVGVGFWVAIPAAVVERPGVFASLSRSWQLTSGNRWRILAILVILVILQIVVEMLVGLFAGAFSDTLVEITEWLVNAPFLALYAVVTAVGYHDLRVAKEGVDVDQIAAIFD